MAEARTDDLMQTLALSTFRCPRRCLVSIVQYSPAVTRHVVKQAWTYDSYSLDAWHNGPLRAKADASVVRTCTKVESVRCQSPGMVVCCSYSSSSFDRVQLQSHLSSMAWDAHLGLHTRSPWPVVWTESYSCSSFCP